jgi:hypothetical protein
MIRTLTARRRAFLLALALLLPALGLAMPQPLPDGPFSGPLKLELIDKSNQHELYASDNLDGSAFTYGHAIIDLDASDPALRKALGARAIVGAVEFLRGNVRDGRMTVTGIGKEPEAPAGSDLGQALEAAETLFQVGVALRDSSRDPQVYHQAYQFMRAGFSAARVTREATVDPTVKERARALTRRAGVAIQDLKDFLD